MGRAAYPGPYPARHAAVDRRTGPLALRGQAGVHRSAAAMGSRSVEYLADHTQPTQCRGDIDLDLALAGGRRYSAGAASAAAGAVGRESALLRGVPSHVDRRGSIAARRGALAS